MSMTTTSLSSFWSKREHSRILLLALPMIISHISAPLIGLVDTAVLGHMAGEHFLAGAAVGAMILTQLYWICGFIRMSTTGLSAQAKGRGDHEKAGDLLCQSLFIALVLGLVFILLGSAILQAGLYLASFEAEAADVTARYFNIRVYGAPAALASMALIGWLIGRQSTAIVMLVQVVGNILNVILNILFVFVFDMSVEGVALASISAEYFIFFACLACALKQAVGINFSFSWLKRNKLAQLMVLNSNMLIRNLALQACLAFIAFQGARLGDSIAATNAILMQFFVLIALGLDAIAYAVEALVGEAKGRNDAVAITLAAARGLLWSGIFAIGYSLIFYYFGQGIINLLTDQGPLQASASSYLPIVVLLPIISHWCFLLDGVFVGLTRARAMSNSMLVSCVLVFFPAWLLMAERGNWALWIALLVFMLARGVSLGGYFIYLQRKALLVH
jgi:MATE family multidrug resistance protein